MTESRHPNGALIYIGSFKIESGIIHVSDPCYENLEDGVDITVKNGIWHGFIRHSKKNSVFTKGDERIKELLAFHDFGQSKDKDDRVVEPRWKKVGNAGVDSGQMCIFDKKFYRDNTEANGRKTDKFEDSESVQIVRKHNKETPKKNGDGELFYDACSCLTLPPPLFDNTLSLGGTLPHGAVSQSGYGDGSYNVYAAKKVFKSMLKDREEFELPEIMAVRIAFIGDKEYDQ